MSISFSGLASGLDTASWVTSLTQLRQAKVTKLETEKSQIAVAQSTLQSIRSFFSSFRSSLEKITDSKFNVSSMDIFSRKLAQVSNNAILTATAKSNAAEGSYEVKVNNIATQTQVKSGYRYKTTIITTTQATNTSYLKNVGVGYGTVPANGITPGDIEITHNGVTSRISITADETMTSFLDKLHDVGINAEFNDETGIFTIDVNRGDINDIGGTDILNKLKIYNVNYGYTCDQLKIEDSHEEYHQATEETALTEFGITVGTANSKLTITTTSGTYEVLLDANETIGSLVSDLRAAGIEATFSDGIFSIENALITSDGNTHLIEHFGLNQPDIASQTQNTSGLTYQTVYADTTTAQLSSKISDIDGVTIDSNKTIIVENLNGVQKTATITQNTTIGQLVTWLNKPATGLAASYDQDTGVLTIDNGWIVGGTFDVEAAFGLQYVGQAGTVTGSALTVTTTTITGATGATQLKDLSTAVTSGSIKVTDTRGNIHYVSINSENTINGFVAQIRGLGLGAEFDETTGKLTLTGGTYTVEGIAENKRSNILSVFFGQTTLTPTDIDSATSTSQQLREQVVTTHMATGTNTLEDIGLNKKTFVATFLVGGTDTVTIGINKTAITSTTIDDLVSAMRTAGINATFNASTSTIEMIDAEFLGVAGTGNLASVMNFTSTITGRYVTSDVVKALTVTTGQELTSSSEVLYTTSVTNTISTTITTTLGHTSNSEPITYNTTVTTQTGSTTGMNQTGAVLYYDVTSTSSVGQTSPTLYYESIVNVGTTTGTSVTTPTLTYTGLSTTGITQTSRVLTYSSVTPGSTTTTTTSASASSGSLMVLTTSTTSQTSGTLGYYSISGGSTTITTVGTAVTGTTMYCSSTTALGQTSGVLTYSYISIEPGSTETVNMNPTQAGNIVNHYVSFDPGSTETVYTNGTQSCMLTYTTTTLVLAQTGTLLLANTHAFDVAGINSGTALLSTFGISSGETITISYSDGTTWSTITSADTNISSLNTAFAAGGLSYQYNSTEGLWLIVDNSESVDKVVVSISDNLCNALGIVAGEGHTYTEGYIDSNVSSKEILFYIDKYDTAGSVSATSTLKNLSYATGSYIKPTVKISMTNGETLTFGQNTTIGSIITTLQSKGIDITLLNPDDYSTIAANSSTEYSSILVSIGAGTTNAIAQVSTRDNLRYNPTMFGTPDLWGYGNSYERTPVKLETITSTATWDTTFADLGLQSDGIMVDNHNVTVTIQTTDTLGDIFTTITNGSTSSGQIYFGENAMSLWFYESGYGLNNGEVIYQSLESEFLTYMSPQLQALLGIDVGEGITYNVNVTPASSTTYTTVPTEGSTFQEFGLEGNAYIVNSNNVTVIVTKSMTFGDLFSLEGYGIDDGSGGLFSPLMYEFPTIRYDAARAQLYTGTSGDVPYLTYMSADLQAILGIDVGEGITYSVNVTPTTITTITETATGDTTFSQLGMNSEGTIKISNGSIITVQTSDSISSLVTALSGQLVNSNIGDTPGVFSISTSGTNYITEMSSNLAAALGIDAGEGISYSVSQVTADTSKTMADLGMSGSIGIITTDSRTITVSASHTLGQVMNSMNSVVVNGTWVNSSDIRATLTNGVLTITNKPDHYLASMTPNLENVFGLEAGYGHSYEINVEGDGVESTYIQATTSTQLSTLGLTQNGQIILNDGQVLTITTDMTISDLVLKLNRGNSEDVIPTGIYATFSDGNLTIDGTHFPQYYTGYYTQNGTKGRYITSISPQLSSVLNIWAGDGISYNTSLGTASTSATLGQLGLTGDAVIESDTGTITVGTDTSISTLTSSISNTLSLGVTYTNGILTISPNNGHILKSMSANLESILGMDVGYGSTYEYNVNVTDPTTTLLTATTATTLGTLGLSGDAVIQTDCMTFTVTSTTTIKNLVNSLKASGTGLNASWDAENNKITITPKTNHYLKSMSSNLAAVLGIDTGYDNSYSVSETTTSATTATTLATLGMSGDAVVQTDSKTFTISSTATINNLMSSLNAAGTGVTASWDSVNHKLTISPNGGYLKAMSGNLQNALHIDVGLDSTYTITDQSSTLLTVTTAATLGSMGLRYDCTIQTSSGSTITVGTNTNMGSLISDLRTAGVYVPDLNNGTLTVGGSITVGMTTYNESITYIDPHLASILGINAGEGISFSTTVTPTNPTDPTVVTMGQLGMRWDEGIIRTNTGEITIHKTDTLASVMQTLTNDYGISATAGPTEGYRLHLTPTAGHWIEYGSPDVLSALGIDAGKDISYTVTDEVVQTSIVTAGTGTTMAQLGMTANGLIITNIGTITVSTSDTIASVRAALTSHTIYSNFTAGTGVLTIGRSADTNYVINMTPNLIQALGNISVGEEFTYVHGTSVDTSQTETIYTSQTITGSQTFGDIGVTSQSKLMITNSLGVTTTVTVDSSTTFTTFMGRMDAAGINVTLTNGIFSMQPDEGYYISDHDGQNILEELNIYTSTYTSGDQNLGSTKLKDLRASDNSNLGITGGNIRVYKDGIASTFSINNNWTLDELASHLSSYNISMSYNSGSSGAITFTSTGDSYLEELAGAGNSNLLTQLGISSWNAHKNTTSQALKYTTNDNIVITGDTKMTDLKNTSGVSLGITTGKYKILAEGIEYDGTITADTTVNDLFTELSRYGITGSISSNGQITLNTSNNNTYLQNANGAAGYSNIVDQVFTSWTKGNIYESSAMDVTTSTTVNMTSETRLKDIDQGTYQAGKFVIKDVKSNTEVATLQLAEDATVGDFMAALAYYGFDSYIENGRLVCRNDGYKTLSNYTAVPSQASNVIDLLGLNTSDWEQPGIYIGEHQTATTYRTELEAATRSTTLSNLRDGAGNSLGITTGQYYLYSNGVRHTMNLTSTDITLDSFMNILEGYGINTIFDTQGGQSTLKIVGDGDSYLETKPGGSNVVEKLFGEGKSTLYNYSGYEQTTELVSTTVIASLATMLTDYDNGESKSEGIFALTVDGVYSEINITSYETFGSLLEKFERAGVQASMTDGVIRLETGNKSFVVDNEHTTSNLLSNLHLVWSNDLGGFAASSDAVTQTTTAIEDRTLSVAKYADDSTQLGLLNISSGTLSVYRQGAKQLIAIDNTETFSQLRSRLQDAFGDVTIDFENGKLRFYSTTEGVDVQVGSSNDTSNISSICGFSQDGEGHIVSARELYKVNASSLITTSNLFRYGDVREGTFVIGDETFTITNQTTIQNIVAQINSSDKANASAYWDSVDGKLVISSRSTGASMVNIEAGTSNFTDILGLTNSEWDGGNNVTITRIRLDSQEIGQNAKFTINGTNFQSASNVITSDISRIQGLTLNLKSASMGDRVIVNVSKDSEAVSEAVGQFVEAYNELVENVDAEITGSGVLKDQSTLKFIKQQIRNLLVNSFSGSTTFRNLAALGISTSAGNTVSAGDVSNAGIEFLYFDSEKFLEGYNKDAEAVKNMLVGSDANPGILIQVENIVENALTTGTGYFSAADKTYSDKIASLNEKIKKANAAIEAYRARLESKFQSMDMMISQMQNQYNNYMKF